MKGEERVEKVSEKGERRKELKLDETEKCNAKNCCCLRCQRKFKFGSNTNSLSKISPYKYLRNCASIHKMTYEFLTIIISMVVPYIDTNLDF